MLVHQDGVAIRVHDDKTCWAFCGLVSLAHKCNALRLELPLQGTQVVEVIDVLRVLIPPWIERQSIFSASL